MTERLEVRMEVNGAWREGVAEPRRTLADFLREDLDLTGTHVACENGFCGNCNVLVDGEPVRSCLMFAVQANGSTLLTVEGLAEPDGTLGRLQQAFNDNHGPDGNLVKLERPPRLRQGFGHERHVRQSRLCQPMLVCVPHFIESNSSPWAVRTQQNATSFTALPQT